MEKLEKMVTTEQSIKLNKIDLGIPKDKDPKLCIWFLSENYVYYRKCLGCTGLKESCKYYKPLSYIQPN